MMLSEMEVGSTDMHAWEDIRQSYQEISTFITNVTVTKKEGVRKRVSDTPSRTPRSPSPIAPARNPTRSRE